MSIQIIEGDCRDMLATLPAQSVHCCVTSPPYFGLRDYGVDGQIGLEPTPDAFVTELVAVFREVRRVLRDDGTVWLNLGDSYANHPSSAVNRNGMSGSLNNGKSEFDCRKGTRGSQKRTVLTDGIKPKDLLGIPWRVAFALQADGWYLRQDIIWHKPNPMPESVTDRCTKAHEYVFLLSKSARYFYDAAAIAEPASTDLRAPDANGSTISGGSHGRSGNPQAYPEHERRVDRRGKGGKNAFRGQGADRDGEGGPANREGRDMRDVGTGDTRNARSVWTIATQPFKEAHFATFPPDLAERCIKAGCPVGGTVLDPFGGAGTTGLVADRLQRNAVLIELNPAYADIARRRIEGDAPLFSEVTE
jgi:DNA modification methylase